MKRSALQGSGPQVLEPADRTQGREAAGPIGKGVVGHDALDPHPQPSEPGEGAAQEADAGGTLLIPQHFRVGQPADPG
jgi:hypothetical protein